MLSPTASPGAAGIVLATPANLRFASSLWEVASDASALEEVKIRRKRKVRIFASAFLLLP